MKTLKIAVVGAGHLGRIHARLLAEMADVELVGVADPVPTARQQVAADCRTQALADHRELVGRCDGAVIATPTRYHHAVALDFLRHGTPLLIEKPLAVNLAEADELVRTAQRSGAVLQVGHIERFNPAFVAAAEHLAEPRYIEAVRASGFTGRSVDIGVVHDLMIHDIDLLLALVDAPVQSVAAVGVALLGKQEDAAQARVEFANGCVANLSASRVSYSESPRRQMHVWCAERFAALDFANRSASVVRPCEAVLEGRFEFEALPADQKTGFKERVFRDILPIESLGVESRNALADELADFVDSIRNAREPRVTGRHGRDAVALAEQILRSIADHRWHAGQPEPPRPILRGPHWKPSDVPRSSRREAG